MRMGGRVQRATNLPGAAGRDAVLTDRKLRRWARHFSAAPRTIAALARVAFFLLLLSILARLCISSSSGDSSSSSSSSSSSRCSSVSCRSRVVVIVESILRDNTHTEWNLTDRKEKDRSRECVRARARVYVCKCAALNM